MVDGSSVFGKAVAWKDVSLAMETEDGDSLIGILVSSFESGREREQRSHHFPQPWLGAAAISCTA